jgi:chitinase
MTVESNDPQSIQTLVSQGPKVIGSVGGWNFPSSYFSKMVASSESRQKFISGAKTFLSANGMKGIDLDWEFPGSPARTDPVKITCEKFRSTQDDGGSSSDGDNLVQFLKELREGLGDDMYISVASQAAKKNWEAMGIKEGSQYVDHWHVMNYDYAVPDIEGEGGMTMSPNAPLYTPSAKGTLQMSIDYSIQGYLDAGVPAEKIMVGIPFYGHTWYSTGMTNWQKFGNKGSVQGKCCGPFKNTYGAKPGQACSQCGVMMYSEILAAGCPTQYDDETKSDVMYCASAGSDSYTEAGTWITYNDKKSIHEITKYTTDKGLGGVFIFDTSMDTVANGNGFTFELMNQIADDLDGGSPSPSPASTYKCVANQCVAHDGGVSKEVCEQVCGSSNLV